MNDYVIIISYFLISIFLIINLLIIFIFTITYSIVHYYFTFITKFSNNFLFYFTLLFIIPS